MKRDEMLLKTAVKAIQAAEPDDAQIAASAMRVADRLGLDGVTNTAIDVIESCDDVQHLLPAYRAGKLENPRTLVIEAHLRECSVCQHKFRAGTAQVDWSVPKAARVFTWRPQAFGWTLASAFALAVFSLFIYRAYWQVPPGVRAEVQSIDGTAYRISANGNRPLAAGDLLQEGDRVRTSGGTDAVLRLADGSTIEVSERSVLGVGARGRDMTVTLDNGDVIVQAAKRTSGHLYLKTRDCRVAVTGTVFSVNAGIKGSRVAVLQGSVHVSHAGIDSTISAGDQLSTSDSLTTEPVEQQIAWSHDREKFLVLLAQFSVLQNRIEQIPTPALRYTSDLVQRVPADTMLYVSIPNLGDFLSQANQVFHEQLQQSPALQQWWNQKHQNNTADLDSLIDKIHQMSQYLGDEIVIVGSGQGNNGSFAIMTDVTKSGLGDLLTTQFPATGTSPGITVLDESSLATAADSAKGKTAYALIRQHEAVFSNSVATLKKMDAQLNAGASGFAGSAFGQQISAAYTRGAGMILAANIQQMIAAKSSQGNATPQSKAGLENSGMNGAQFLIAEHRERNGHPENRVSLQFSGARQGVASWLAEPAPIGSLDFVTPNAAVALALLSKDPKAIADDIIAMASRQDGGQGLSDAEAKLQINFRDDLAANLGGDFLVSLDGPVLPTPSWKAVIEVRDSAHLEQTIEQLVKSIQGLSQGKKAHSIAIESEVVAGQTYYLLRDVTTGNAIAQYTYSNGYMVVAPSRAMIMQALQTQQSGNSLAQSTAFKALLPKDKNENYSAIAYQNLTPVLTPLLSQFTGDTANALSQLAADARPTVICARGEQTRLEAASDSHLFGFDFLTLGTLMNSGNKKAVASVNN
jgi:hypothetical protein